jgi:hypothetical protein
MDTTQYHPMAQDILEATDALAEAVEYETRLEDYRPEHKMAAIQRIMTEANPLNGKPHSASSAEAVVETDIEYKAYRQRQRDAVVRTIKARGLLAAAKANAALHAGVAA